MIPEFGQIALSIALCVAIVQAIVPMIGAQTGRVGWMHLARTAANWQLLWVFISYACLTYAFASNDFTVQYVATNSNSQLPIYYRLSAVWGAHEGSFLLWALILSIWTAAIARYSQSLPLPTVARVLSVMAIIAIGFLSFLLIASNPFERTLPMFPVDGRDLNPLLQDPGFIIHPPMLYMGYVGCSVAFAFAIAALIGGELDSAWAKWSRPWTLAAWVFLTAGITLGSWWAYYELGWGGWWFWDPVENASFMPWLASTALLHSLAVSEKRGGLKSWTVLLAISAFSLSLLGTFLVRSGIITSVHAFANDPVRGLFILIFLGLVIGASLLLFAFRAGTIKSPAHYEWCSREIAVLANNVLLSVTCAMVLLGTLQPLIADALQLGKISVGAPYFNFMFAVFMVPLIFLVAIGPHLHWRKDTWAGLAKRLWWVALLALVLALSLAALFSLWQPGVLLALLMAVWIILSLSVDVFSRWRQRHAQLASSSTRFDLTGMLSALRSLPRAFFGMVFAHAGLAVATIGIALSMALSVEKDLRLSPGQTAQVGPYQFQFVRLRDHEGPNFTAARAYFDVQQDGKTVARLQPEKRTYNASGQSMTEAAIDAGLTRDLYIAMGEPLTDKAWAVRVYYKPFVRWIWLGGVFMVIGGVLAASDLRYRRSQKVAQVASPATLADSEINSVSAAVSGAQA